MTKKTINAPELLGRSDHGTTDEISVRSPTVLVASLTHRFDAVAIGTLTFTVFKGVNTMDEAGYVIRITTDNEASAFTPHAETIKNGVEIHMAGQVEADTFMASLAELTTQIASTPAKRNFRRSK